MQAKQPPPNLWMADLHVHSKYSLATSRNCDLPNLTLWAEKKGITLIATGDCLHPQWLHELQQYLLPAEPGFFQLHPQLRQENSLLAHQPQPNQSVRFILASEISSIYKRDGKVRKIHNLIYLPNFASVLKLYHTLRKIGNLNADGRPILSLDPHDLLDILLQIDPEAFLIPAHIWTPWYSLFGSQSGVDRIEHCFGDLSNEIFALETGLSSDPAMNRRWSHLDRFRLVSNSDAHSPAKLGREATLLTCDKNYYALRAALKTGCGYHGTLEFFPEEGKYFWDGHRQCGVAMPPEASCQLNSLCPKCGHQLTLGVLHRLAMLADRPPLAPDHDLDLCYHLIPLHEIIAETLGTSPNTQKVAQLYEHFLLNIGQELTILLFTPLEEIAKHAGPRLMTAIDHMRQGLVTKQAGYDGLFGLIRTL